MEHAGDNLISFFKNAGTRLEELQVQAALGKAELAEKLEKLKSDSRHKLAELKADVKSIFHRKEEKYQHLHAKLEQLEVQLSLAKAETRDELLEQKKNLLRAIEDVKQILAGA